MKTGRGEGLLGRLEDLRARLRVPLPATLGVAVVLTGAVGSSVLGLPSGWVAGLWASSPPLAIESPAATDAVLAERMLAMAVPPFSVAPTETVVAALSPTASTSISTPSVAVTEPMVTSGVIEPKGTLAQSLRGAGVSSAMVQQIAQEMQSVLDFRAARAGDRYHLRRGPDGDLKEFTYLAESGKNYRIVADGDRFVAEVRGLDVVRRTTRAAGVIQSTLYDAIQGLGESRQLASDFAEIFQWDLDFAHGVKRGDEFQILYERLYRVRADGRETFLRPGRILAARYKGAQGDLTALYFESEEGRGAYYRPDGSPMERAFLAAPLKYERVSSNFSASRLHPILEVVRPHLGIDYTAPEGTPLWSVADGTVVFKGWGGGFGNLVKVEHANGYVSFYSHLSRFPRDLKVGSRVRQKQVIGYVGSSGLATGSHVCFRVQKDGKFVNPARLRSGALASASVAKRGDFRTAKDTLLADLGSRPMVAVDEAL